MRVPYVGLFAHSLEWQSNIGKLRMPINCICFSYLFVINSIKCWIESITEFMFPLRRQLLWFFLLDKEMFPILILSWVNLIFRTLLELGSFFHNLFSMCSSFIRPIIDIGTYFYNNTAKTNLKTQKIIQNKALQDLCWFIDSLPSKLDDVVNIY